ncbi:MAG: hypothetical protein AAGJ35_08170, partial [Myxococcota bacterium]
VMKANVKPSLCVLFAKRFVKTDVFQFKTMPNTVAHAIEYVKTENFVPKGHVYPHALPKPQTDVWELVSICTTTSDIVVSVRTVVHRESSVETGNVFVKSGIRAAEQCVSTCCIMDNTAVPVSSPALKELTATKGNVSPIARTTRAESAPAVVLIRKTIPNTVVPVGKLAKLANAARKVDVFVQQRSSFVDDIVCAFNPTFNTAVDVKTPVLLHKSALKDDAQHNAPKQPPSNATVDASTLKSTHNTVGHAEISVPKDIPANKPSASLLAHNEPHFPVAPTSVSIHKPTQNIVVPVKPLVCPCKPV